MATVSAAQRGNGHKRKAKRAPRGRPFEPGNEWRFQPGESPNPGGRPKVLVEAYLEVLGYVDVDDINRTQALAIAQKMCERALAGDVQAAREVRMATEGSRLRFSFDLSRMNDEQLARLAAGEHYLAVLAAGELAEDDGQA